MAFLCTFRISSLIVYTHDWEKAFFITLRTLYVLSHCKKTINFSVLLAKKVSQRTNFQGKYAKEKNVKLNKIYRLHFIPKEIIFKEFENILYVWYI